MVAKTAVPPARTTAAMASPAAFQLRARAPSSAMAKRTRSIRSAGTCSATITSARPATPRRALVSGTKTRSASRSVRSALSVRCSGSPGPTPTPMSVPASRDRLRDGAAHAGGGRRDEARGHARRGGPVRVQVAGVDGADRHGPRRARRRGRAASTPEPADRRRARRASSGTRGRARSVPAGQSAVVGGRGRLAIAEAQAAPSCGPRSGRRRTSGARRAGGRDRAGRRTRRGSAGRAPRRRRSRRAAPSWPTAPRRRPRGSRRRGRARRCAGAAPRRPAGRGRRAPRRRRAAARGSPRSGRRRRARARSAIRAGRGSPPGSGRHGAPGSSGAARARRDERVEVAARLDRGAELGERLPRARLALGRRHEAEVALGRGEGVVAAQDAEHRHAERLDGLAQQQRVALAADAVEDHAGDVDLGVVAGVAVDDGRCGARERGGVEDEHDGRAQELGHVGGGGQLAAARRAVVEAHDALDDGDVGPGAAVTKERCDAGRVRRGRRRGCARGARWPARGSWGR